MSHYRRLYAPGGTYFFTVVTAARQPLFAERRNTDLLRQSFRYVRQRRPFELVAIAVLPDHLHCLWQLPEDDADYSTRWQMLKTAFTRRWAGNPSNNRSKALWQPRFWEHLIRDEEDLRRHLDYIHFNPVKHGLVAAPGAWPASSFKRYVEKEWYAADWGAHEPENIKRMTIEQAGELPGTTFPPGTAYDLIPAYIDTLQIAQAGISVALPAINTFPA